MNKIFLSCCLSLATCGVCLAQQAVTRPDAGAVLDYPLLDLPFNYSKEGYQAPSMAQSLGWSKAFYQTIHFQFSRILSPGDPGWKGFGARMALIGIDGLMSTLPLGDGWMHEEWHRAVMTRRGISSYNGIYDFTLKGLIPVRKVTDEDLTRLKGDQPAEFVRMSAAGMESQHELAQALESDIFFGESQIWMGSTILYAHLSPILYMDHCTSAEADLETARSSAAEPKMADRDFTGLDCLGWVYDLFRQDEPYSARGPHPSGNGIDRYRSYGGLTKEERRYLKRARDRSWLNLVDPFMVDIGHFYDNLGQFKFNATLRHHIASFGEAMDLNLFASMAGLNALIITHAYQNHERAFPGFELRLIRQPFQFVGKSFLVTKRFMIWQQPKEQRFMTAEGETGGLIGLRVDDQNLKAWHPYFELEGKTAGWVAGNVYLDRNLSLRAGLSQVLN